ncbi:DUF2878 domain-containing protein [Shewanella sp. GXUN23E]|uniref:DUF2878 domain-containing protein n=1 Tax=Shewanella sp. GXUN23E TaxID=3422498 RepID=UPI003D7D878C
MISGRVWIGFNALSFQLVWWSGVVMGNASLNVSVILLVIHLVMTPCRRPDIRLLSLMAAPGIILDGLLCWLGLLQFQSLPWWLVLLWLHFALSFNASLSFLTRFPVWGVALLGAIFGPLSYVAGSRLGAVYLPQGDIITALVLAGIWLLLLPLGGWLARMSHANGGAPLTETQ